jgi:hypothetical protein
MALLDRIVDSAIILKIAGKSRDTDAVRRRLCLARNSDRLRAALSKAVHARSRRTTSCTLVFEFGGHFYRLELFEPVGEYWFGETTELLPDGWLLDELPEGCLPKAKEAGMNWDLVLEGMLLPWLADCWQEVNTPQLRGQAYVTWFGSEARYDLERRAWSRGG